MDMTRETRCAAAEAVVKQQRHGSLTNSPWESAIYALEQSMQRSPDDLKGASLSALNRLRVALDELQAAVMGEPYHARVTHPQVEV